MTSYLCPICIESFFPIESPMCPQCGLMFKSREGADHLCGECLQTNQPFGIARAAGVYEQALMAVVHGLKYGQKTRLAYPLSQLLLSVLLKYWQDRPIDLIVPVPLYPKRFRRRGFNQAYLVVKYWQDQFLYIHPMLANVKIDRTVLKRNRPTPPQTGLGRKERLSNIKNAFMLQKPSVVKDKSVLIIDDVYTTGATVKECAKALLEGVAAQVDILTLARAL